MPFGSHAALIDFSLGTPAPQYLVCASAWVNAVSAYGAYAGKLAASAPNESTMPFTKLIIPESNGGCELAVYPYNCHTYPESRPA